MFWAKTMPPNEDSSAMARMVSRSPRGEAVAQNHAAPSLRNGEAFRFGRTGACVLSEKRSYALTSNLKGSCPKLNVISVCESMPTTGKSGSSCGRAVNATPSKLPLRV